MDLLRRLRVTVHVHDDGNGTVEAGPEALSQQVIGPAAGLLLGLCALVGGAEAYERRGQREGHDHHQHDREHELRVRGHEPAPAGDERLLAAHVRIVHAAKEWHFQPVDLVAEERQHCQQQRVRDQHRGQDAEGAADSELGHEVQADEGQAAHRDGHRQAGEEHGTPGGGAGFGGSVARGKPVMQQLSEAGDDEQRVVDADPQPDHRDEDGRDRVDVGQPGEDEQQQERRRQRRDRQHDRDDHRHEGAEHEEEDDDRREQAERLRRTLLDRWKLGFAVELDRHPGWFDRLANGILHGDDLIAVLCLDRLIELGLGVRDAAVVGDRVLAERIPDALHACLVALGLELRRLEACDGLLDRGLALGRVEPLSLGCREDDVQHGALLGGELGLDQVGRLLRLRPRDLELVPE